MRSRPPTGTESAALEPRSYPDGWSALWRGSGGRAEEVNLKKKKEREKREKERRFNHHGFGKNTKGRNRGKIGLMLTYFLILR